MDALFWFNVLTRWLHVTSAVIAVGALLLLPLLLIPALQVQEPAVRQAMLAQVAPRLRIVLHSALGLLLVTGFYNYWVAIPKVRALENRSLYHPIIGTKILLALILFGMVSALLSSRDVAANMGEDRSRWLAVLIILALVILFLSAILRRLWA